MSGSIPDDGGGGLLEHIEALRTSIIKSVCVYAVFCIPCWIFSQEMVEWLMRYAAPDGFKLHYFTLLEPFFTRIKVTLVAALLFSLPFILWNLWRFIVPALTPDEQKMMHIPMLASFFLATFGAAAALFFIVPAVVAFSLSFATAYMEPVIGIGDFVSLILLMMLASAVLFQFPIIIYALLASGIASLDSMKKKRSIVLVAVLIIAALLTPPDVVSQLMLGVPAYLLFEISLLVFSLKGKKKNAES